MWEKKKQGAEGNALEFRPRKSLEQLGEGGSIPPKSAAGFEIKPQTGHVISHQMSLVLHTLTVTNGTSPP